ncbi:MAG: dihydrofolate reductase family protein [Spirochaetia bacterium]
MPKNPKYTLYIAISLDGYIADRQGGVDWLNTFDDGHKDKHSKDYNNFIATIDSIIMGRTTYEQILTFGSWCYEGKISYVLTNDVNYSCEHAVVVQPNEVDMHAKIKGKHLWVMGGAKTVEKCLEVGMINELIITVIPVILGSGIPLFGENNRLEWLDLDGVKQTGRVVELRYSRKI